MTKYTSWRWDELNPEERVSVRRMERRKIKDTMKYLDLNGEEEMEEALDRVSAGVLDSARLDTNSPSIRNGEVISKYQDISPLYKVGDILTVNRVVVSEKIHGCVKYNTRVSLPDGESKPIISLREGDEILGLNEFGRVTTGKVVKVHRGGGSKRWVKVSFTRVGAGRGNSYGAIVCTPEHWFFSPTSKEYISAKDLEIGSRVLLLRSELGLTPIQEQILLGKMLGDGSYSENASSALISGSQVLRDREYVDWFMSALGSLDSGCRDDSQISGFGSRQLRWRTTSSGWIKNKFSSFRTERGKQIPPWVADELGPISMAIWYMDDGSLGHMEDQEDRALFATCGFNESSIQVLQHGLRKFGIKGEKFQSDSYWRLRLNSNEAEKFFLLISPYIPPSMQYKLPLRYRGHQGWMPKMEGEYKPHLVEQEIIKVEEIKNSDSLIRYDLTTTLGNYFANNVLVHNTNVRFGIVGGEFFYGGRNRIGGEIFGFEHLASSLEDKMRRAEILNMTFYGEWYGPGIQKGIEYGTEKRVVIFDVKTNNGTWLTVEAAKASAAAIGLDFVPILYEGKPSLEIFDGLRKRNSTLAFRNGVDVNKENLSEGIVIRAVPDMFDVYGHRVLAKYKNEKFSEVRGEPRIKGELVIGEDAKAFVNTFVTEERLNHVLHSLEELGENIRELSVMPKFISATIADLNKEAGEEFAALGDNDRFVGKLITPILRQYLMKMRE